MCSRRGPGANELNAQWVWKVPDGCSAKKVPPVELWQLRNGSAQEKDQHNIWCCVGWPEVGLPSQPLLEHACPGSTLESSPSRHA